MCAYWAVPGSSISQTTWIGFSSFTFLRHVDEGAAGPEGGGRGGELALLVREPLHEVALDQLRVLLGGALERADTITPCSAASGSRCDVDRAGAALHDQAGVLLVAQVLAHDLRQLVGRLVVARLELVELELAQRGGPEAGAPPGGHRLALVDLERGPALLLDEARGRQAPAADLLADPLVALVLELVGQLGAALAHDPAVEHDVHEVGLHVARGCACSG